MQLRVLAAYFLVAENREDFLGNAEAFYRRHAGFRASAFNEYLSAVTFGG